MDDKILSEAPRFDEKKDVREMVRELMEYNQKLAESLRYNLRLLETKLGGDGK